ncbi:MAG: hypothetical protein U0736_18455 [Gemmataceae bacterium]
MKYTMLAAVIALASMTSAEAASPTATAKAGRKASLISARGRCGGGFNRCCSPCYGRNYCCSPCSTSCCYPSCDSCCYPSSCYPCYNRCSSPCYSSCSPCYSSCGRSFSGRSFNGARFRR